jgi:transcriptional regulator with GAF, ATPase, and Fis domain
MAEILNIDYHTKRLVTEALIRSKDVADAATKLEVSVRSVFRYMKKFEIDYKEIKKARKDRITFNTKEK